MEAMPVLPHVKNLVNSSSLSKPPIIDVTLGPKLASEGPQGCGAYTRGNHFHLRLKMADSREDEGQGCRTQGRRGSEPSPSSMPKARANGVHMCVCVCV